MRFTNSLQKVFLQYLEFSHVKIIFRSSKHNFLVVFLAVKSISFLGWVLNLLTLKNIAINFMVSFTTNNSIWPQKTATMILVTICGCWWTQPSLTVLVTFRPQYPSETSMLVTVAHETQTSFLNVGDKPVYPLSDPVTNTQKSDLLK